MRMLFVLFSVWSLPWCICSWFHLAFLRLRLFQCFDKSIRATSSSGWRHWDVLLVRKHFRPLLRVRTYPWRLFLVFNNLYLRWQSFLCFYLGIPAAGAFLLWMVQLGCSARARALLVWCCGCTRTASMVHMFMGLPCLSTWHSFQCFVLSGLCGQYWILCPLVDCANGSAAVQHF